MAVIIKELFFPFEPIGAPRMTRCDKWKKRPCVERYFEYRDRINYILKNNGICKSDLHNLHRIDWYACFQLKKSFSKKKCSELTGTPHTMKPDKDNIEKALMDSIFKDAKPADDCQVACGWSQKLWCSTGSMVANLYFGDPLECLRSPVLGAQMSS